MKRRKFAIFTILFLLVIGLIGAFFLVRYYSGRESLISNLQTYTAHGFSFEYSADFYVGDDTNNTDGGWIYVLPIAYKNNPNGDTQAIVISPRANHPSQTALDWLKDPNSGGYDISQGYKTVKVGGQDAISVENGDWVVVNTPDNTERISIAILPPFATSTSPTDLTALRNEMTLVQNSLSFGIFGNH